jgi:hypothetical protein
MPKFECCAAYNLKSRYLCSTLCKHNLMDVVFSDTHSRALTPEEKKAQTSDGTDALPRALPSAPTASPPIKPTGEGKNEREKAHLPRYLDTKCTYRRASKSAEKRTQHRACGYHKVHRSPPGVHPETSHHIILWYLRLTHMHSTAIRSLINDYIYDDSICTIIEAKYKKKLIRVKVKRTTKPFELVHSDLWVILFGGRRCYILYDYTRYTSIWVLPGKKSNTCTCAYRSFQLFWLRVIKGKAIRCNNAWDQYYNKLFRMVLTTRGTTYEPYSQYAHHKNGVRNEWFRQIPRRPTWCVLTHSWYRPIHGWAVPSMVRAIPRMVPITFVWIISSRLMF